MALVEHRRPRLKGALNACHPERSLAIREANRQTKSKDPYEFVLPAKNWMDVIGTEFDKTYMTELKEFLQEENDDHTIFPEREEIFNALNLTPFDKVKVVIIGQDPYHGKGEAHGLCFSTKGSDIPPSLRNIYNEIDDEYRPVEIERHGDLTGWAKQGVLLLNATLTVQKDKAGSHRRKGKGWEKFTDAVIRAVNEKPGPVVFMLWGRRAQEKRALIGKNHKVLEASHPSPFSVGRCLRDGEIHSFCGCGHFKTANAHLKKHGLERIDWHSRLYT